ncbi:BgtAc-30016 [Blumeria graminis f. sp. tritici]|uniref:BgtAc-30016 n=2 Tax=Blumeria graminis f. sp. tritici TaxID=62690 RepID=A0A9X9PQH3_BLUGR|nr:BgtAc-30016 [Blumeria graminis f. sp. tritici]
MAPATRSSSAGRPNDDNASELTLADVMKTLNIIVANQTTQSDGISKLDERMTAIENVVFEIGDKPTNHQLDRDESSSVNLEPGQRDPFTMPGKPSSTCPQFRAFVALNGLPGPRGPNNLLILSESHVDWKGRSSWPSHNFNSAYIQWLWGYWCELTTETDLSMSHLHSQNGNKSFRAGLHPLCETDDIENLSYLHKIQAALMQQVIEVKDTRGGPIPQKSEQIAQPKTTPSIPLCDQKFIQLSIDSLKQKFSDLFNTSQTAGSATRVTGVKYEIILRSQNAQHKSAPARDSPMDTEVIQQFIQSASIHAEVKRNADTVCRLETRISRLEASVNTMTIGISKLCELAETRNILLATKRNAQRDNGLHAQQSLIGNSVQNANSSTWYYCGTKLTSRYHVCACIISHLIELVKLRMENKGIYYPDSVDSSFQVLYYCVRDCSKYSCTIPDIQFRGEIDISETNKKTTCGYASILPLVAASQEPSAVTTLPESRLADLSTALTRPIMEPVSRIVQRMCYLDCILSPQQIDILKCINFPVTKPNTDDSFYKVYNVESNTQSVVFAANYSNEPYNLKFTSN